MSRPKVMDLIERYRVLTPSLLAGALAAGEAELAVVAHVGPRVFGKPEALRTLPPPLRVVFVTKTLEDQVASGGFHQYFWNGGTSVADEAIAAYEALGLKAHASLVAEAIARQASHAPSGWHPGRTLAAYAASPELHAFQDLDKRFWELPQTEATGRRIAFLRDQLDQAFDTDPP